MLKRMRMERKDRKKKLRATRADLDRLEKGGADEVEGEGK
jgi:hypothetical protein